MKKLYENIEDIDIEGDVGQLSEVVTKMDVALQNIAEYTKNLTDQLMNYNASNKGARYEWVVKVSLELRDKLCDASENLNEMQNQVVAYQNKIYRYEGMPENAQAPNPYLVTKSETISIETSSVQFNRSEMIELSKMLRQYAAAVFEQTRAIVEEKNSIAGVWKDTQYNDFSEYIDLIAKNIGDALKEFESYVLYLDVKIKELS